MIGDELYSHIARISKGRPENISMSSERPKDIFLGRLSDKCVVWVGF